MSDKSQGMGCLVAVGLRVACVCEVWVSGTWGFTLSSVLRVSPKGDGLVV